MSTLIKPVTPTALLLFGSMAFCIPARADLLITEVIPGVSTAVDRGDTVELYNSGPSSIDLTGYVLSDLDDGSVEANVLAEGTFAPGSLGLPALQADEFAVVVFVDSTGGTLFQYWETNYGLLIHAPLATAASSYLGSTYEELLLTDATGTPLDFVAWSDGNTLPSNEADTREDISALTSPASNYGFTFGSAEWLGPDLVPDLSGILDNTVDFSSFTSVSTYGGGAIRRRSTNGVFDVASPDSFLQFEAIPRDQVLLGNPSDDVTTVDGLRPIRFAGDIALTCANLESSTFPYRRIARDEDQVPADFVNPSAGDMTAWDGILAMALANQWEQSFAAATAQGYEVIEFLDLPSGRTFHILQERVIPGEPGFRGQGVFMFDGSLAARPYLVLEVPHPRHDSLTEDEGGIALRDLRARVLMIAGTHRNNHPSFTTCDGTFEGGDPYHISDVAHHPDNFFHESHKRLEAALPSMLSIQFHGFCCPGDANHAAISDDCVVSNGFDAVPAVDAFARLVEQQIEAQMFMADDGTFAGDLTTAGLYGEEVFDLGGTNNLQGRFTNGVAEGDECNTDALSASGQWLHLEQDLDVREEPQHIVNAIEAALLQWEAAAGVSGWEVME